MPQWDGPSNERLFRGEVVRYLGVFLGTDDQVAREWNRRVTAKIQTRYNSWITRGGTHSLAGRNIVIKTSVMAIAWYLVANQTPPNIDDMISAWEQESWRFFEHTQGSGPTPSPGRAGPIAPRHILVQDYPEGGLRCLNIELHVRATYMRHIRKLLDPTPQHWKGMALHWLNLVYGPLRQGARLLLSACDFLAVLTDARVPPFWQTVLVCWGMGDAPIPTPPPLNAETRTPSGRTSPALASTQRGRVGPHAQACVMNRYGPSSTSYANP